MISANLLKRLRKLRQKKYRDEDKLFLAEGFKFLDFDIDPVYIIIREDVEVPARYSAKLAESQVYQANSKDFDSLSSMETPQGIILVYEYLETQREHMSDNIVILDGISDPGNAGTILRTCDAGGFRDIILTKGSVDIYNDKVVRSTMGSLFNLNIRYIDKQELISMLGSKGYHVFATMLDKSAISYADMKLYRRNAFVFGNEANGVSQELIDIAQTKVFIPMFGSAESLNVSVATGITLFKVREILNQ